MKPLPNFWRAIEEIVGGSTDPLEWKELLGDEWEAARSLLRTTGELAKRIGCPSPAGDGCPRHVVAHGDGTFSAVCGDRPGGCKTLTLSRSDLSLLAVDQQKLVRELAVVFGTTGEIAKQRSIRNFRYVGDHMIAAGLGIPIYLNLPSPRDESRGVNATILGSAAGPLVLLTPTHTSIEARVSQSVHQSGGVVVALEHAVGITTDGRLAAARPAPDLLQHAREHVLRAAAEDRSAPVWLLPPDAGWNEMILEFEAPQMLRVTFRGDFRHFEPVDLGMRDGRTKGPSMQWFLLAAFAERAGTIDPAETPISADVRKHKQLLSADLRRAFGLEADPIIWDKRRKVYQARFLIRGDAMRSR